jgi:hypothetical protein
MYRRPRKRPLRLAPGAPHLALALRLVERRGAGSTADQAVGPALSAPAAGAAVRRL